MLSCKDATRLASEAMDRNLSRRERFALGFHLFLCRFCRAFRRNLRGLHAAAEQLGGELEATIDGEALSGSLDSLHSSKILRPEARQRIKQLIEDGHA